MAVVRLYVCFCLFFFIYTATTEIYTYGHTRSLHDALPIYHGRRGDLGRAPWFVVRRRGPAVLRRRRVEHEPDGPRHPAGRAGRGRVVRGAVTRDRKAHV